MFSVWFNAHFSVWFSKFKGKEFISNPKIQQMTCSWFKICLTGSSPIESLHMWGQRRSKILQKAYETSTWVTTIEKLRCHRKNIQTQLYEGNWWREINGSQSLGVEEIVLVNKQNIWSKSHWVFKVGTLNFPEEKISKS